MADSTRDERGGFENLRARVRLDGVSASFEVRGPAGASVGEVHAGASGGVGGGGFGLAILREKLAHRGGELGVAEPKLPSDVRQLLGAPPGPLLDDVASVLLANPEPVTEGLSGVRFVEHLEDRSHDADGTPCAYQRQGSCTPKTYYVANVAARASLQAMDFAERMKTALKARGLSKVELGKRAGFSKQHVNGIVNDGVIPAFDKIQAIAKAFAIDTGALTSDDDQVFLAALNDPDTASDPELVDDVPVSTGDGGGTERPIPVYAWMTHDGDTRGVVATDTMQIPSNDGEKLKQTVRQRGPRNPDRTPKPIDHVKLPGVPKGAEVAKATERVEIKDTGEVIAAGYYVVFDRKTKPAPEQLVLAKKDDPDPYAPVDPKFDWKALPIEKRPGVLLARYKDHGGGAYALLLPDGRGVTLGTGDGWSVIASVLWWRPAPWTS